MDVASLQEFGTTYTAAWYAGWSRFTDISRISADSRGRTIWIIDAHRDDGKRFVVSFFPRTTSRFPLLSGDHEADRRIRPLFEIARVLMRVDYVARFIVNAHHGIL